MEKSKFTLRVDSEQLKDMKVESIHQGKALNELLIESYQFYMSFRNSRASLICNDEQQLFIFIRDINMGIYNGNDSNELKKAIEDLETYIIGF